MPSFPPRIMLIRKQEELYKRELELLSVIRKNIPKEKIIQKVEKYRTAQLSLLKAKVHSVQEKNFQSRPFESIDALTNKMKIWQEKTVEKIINGINK